jgi:hypothetical protein
VPHEPADRGALHLDLACFERGAAKLPEPRRTQKPTTRQ